MGLLSLYTTKKEIHKKNEFGWFPIQEVAYLFAGIFMTIIPALAILKAGEKGELAFIIEAMRSPVHYFWITGTLSSFLDNAPTYLTFLNTQLGNSFAGSDGLTYFYRQFEPLEQEPLTIRMEYTKSDDSLSIEQQDVQPSQPIQANPTFSFQGRSLLPWILGGLGLGLLLAAAVLFWGFDSGNPLADRFTALFSGRGGDSAGGYCPQCGSPRGKEDRFCRQCGHQF